MTCQVVSGAKPAIVDYLIVSSYAVVLWFLNVPVMVCFCVVPERPNITNVYAWVDEEHNDPQPVIYVEWTVCNIVWLLFLICATIFCDHHQPLCFC